MRNTHMLAMLTFMVKATSPAPRKALGRQKLGVHSSAANTQCQCISCTVAA